jgi:hypothetical protein
VVDPGFFGDLLASARKAARMKTRHDLSAAIEAKYGFEVSPDVIGKYERGDSVPTLEMFLLLVAVLEPRGGIQHFMPAVLPDIARAVL